MPLHFTAACAAWNCLLKKHDMKNFTEALGSGTPSGTLHLSSGKIVACDPLADPNENAFTQTVPPGDYPCELHYNDDGRPMLACLRFSDAPVAEWRIAAWEGQDPSTLKENEIFGYPVDAGMGCFMDADTAKLYFQLEAELNEKIRKEKGPDAYANLYDDLVDPAMAESGDYDFLDLHPYADKPGNILMFTSGWGDGFYASYWGYDANGKPVALVTDFGFGEDEDY